MAYTDIDNPSETAFNTVLYTGNGSTQSITGVGFQPDLIWIKERNLTSSHAVTDSVRGNTKKLKTDGGDVEETNTNLITSFDSNGFSLGANGNANQSSSQTYVSWNWKAGTSFSNSAGANGADLASVGSYNRDAGFSIVTWTGNATDDQQIYHGLNAVPQMMLVKNRTNSNNESWAVYHQSIGNTKKLTLDTTATPATSVEFWSDETPTSTVFTVGRQDATNNNSMIAYCFAPKQGYSKFGSYDANENVDGPFIYTGFKPAFVILKQSNLTRDWHMFDNKRSPFNAVGKYLRPNEYGAEDSGEEYVDFLSNGFKIKNTGNRFNDAGGTYIFMAFAEQPFVTSTGVPATAR